jgi:hypothetical protein
VAENHAVFIVAESIPDEGPLFKVFFPAA